MALCHSSYSNRVRINIGQDIKSKCEHIFGRKQYAHTYLAYSLHNTYQRQRCSTHRLTQDFDAFCSILGRNVTVARETRVLSVELLPGCADRRSTTCHPYTTGLAVTYHTYVIFRYSDIRPHSYELGCVTVGPVAKLGSTSNCACPMTVPPVRVRCTSRLPDSSYTRPYAVSKTFQATMKFS